MTFSGNGLVWDKEKGRSLCSFGKKREFTTTDERTIKILMELGYKPSLSASELEKIEVDKKNLLREELKEELRRELEQEAKKKKG